MKRLLILFLVVILSAHTCHRPSENYDDAIMISHEDTLNRCQLDSLFFADSLSFNIEEDWIQSMTISEDKKDMMYKYVYIKSLTDSSGFIYTLCTYQDTLYIVDKLKFE